MNCYLQKHCVSTSRRENQYLSSFEGGFNLDSQKENQGTPSPDRFEKESIGRSEGHLNAVFKNQQRYCITVTLAGLWKRWDIRSFSKGVMVIESDMKREWYGQGQIKSSRS